MRYCWGGEWTEPTIAVAEKEPVPPSKYPTWPVGQPLRFRVKFDAMEDQPRRPSNDPRLREVRVMTTQYCWMNVDERDTSGTEPAGELHPSEFGGHIQRRSYQRMHYFWWVELRDPGEFFAFLDAQGDQVTYTPYADGNNPIEGVDLAGALYIGPDDC